MNLAKLIADMDRLFATAVKPGAASIDYTTLAPRISFEGPP